MARIWLGKDEKTLVHPIKGEILIKYWYKLLYFGASETLDAQEMRYLLVVELNYPVIQYVWMLKGIIYD